jgi:Sortase domain
MSGGRRSLLAAIGIFLALSGTTLIAVAMTTQEPPPQPTVAAAGVVDPPPVSPSHPRAAVVETVLPRSKPVAIDIPSIGVRSSILSLGLNADGTVQVPSGTSYDEAGWYRFSPTPGSLGPAVILGHVSGAGHASVFFRLGDLRPGNRVRVTRRDGSIAAFEVTGVRRYPKDHFPTQLVYGNTNHAALRLITCGGSFDFSTGHYLDNVVVFATLVDRVSGHLMRVTPRT